MTAPSTAQAAALAVAAQHYTQRANLVQSAVLALAEWWSYISRSNINGSWLEVVSPGMLAVTTEGQRRAADGAATYLSRVAALTAPGTPLATPRTDGFVGQAADLRPLESLLDVSRQHTLRMVAAGAPVDEALTSGLAVAQRAVATEVQDAGRNADHVALIAQPTMQGYVRFLNLPSCAPCVVLAGRFYRWSAGFERHPTCDCTHLPSAVANPDRTVLTDPAQALATGQVQGLSSADLQALEMGADLGRVVNIKRGKVRVSGSGVRRIGRRLTTGSIYEQAGDNRERALELLQQHGYI